MSTCTWRKLFFSTQKRLKTLESCYKISYLIQFIKRLFSTRNSIGWHFFQENTSDYREFKIVFNLKAAPKNGFAFDNVGFKPRPHHTREICKPCTIIHHETGAFLKCTNRGNTKTLASSFRMEVRLKNGDKTITVCDLPT